MFLGIEIGGTKLQLGVGPGNGTLAGIWRGGVDLDAGAAGIRRQIVAAVPELLGKSGIDRSQLQAVGFGFGGPVDDATRGVLKSHQVGGWEGFPLADWAEETLGLPAVLGNDADCAALAEALFGAGRGFSPVFYMTIGSGIGGGLVIDGEVYRGAGKGAVEVGHLKLGHFGHNTLEEVASGWGIEQAARARGFAPAYVPAIVRASDQGNAIASEIIADAWRALTEAICHVIVLLCPRRIVIGGGVSLLGEDALFEPLRRLVAESVFKPFADCYEIVPAALGESVVVHGAIALAARQLGV